MDPSDPEKIDDASFERELTRHDLRPETGSWGWSPGRIMAVVLVVAMAGFWTWAFLWSPRGHPDELDDQTFPTFAEDRCVAALEAIASVPGARDAVDLDDRAGQIESTTDILSMMVADLRANAPANSQRDGDLVARWLADWEIYLSDRYSYASDFRRGIDQPFAVTAIDGDQVTSPLDLFATINRMPSCVSPGDV